MRTAVILEWHSAVQGQDSGAYEKYNACLQEYTSTGEITNTIWGIEGHGYPTGPHIQSHENTTSVKKKRKKRKKKTSIKIIKKKDPEK